MTEKYLRNGFKQDSISGEPAVRYWHKNGVLSGEIHHQNGVEQDPDINSPALKLWHENGKLFKKIHDRDGLFHDPNHNTPAYTKWDKARKSGRLRIHFCRHVKVPIEFWKWTIEDALNTNNLEQRRVWFEENGGWEVFESEFKLIDEQPDPANSNFTLRLCKFPRRFDMYDGQAHIIFCNNASLDLDGSRRRYALVVPISWGDNALDVMARSFGLTRDEYTMLKVAK